MKKIFATLSIMLMIFAISVFVFNCAEQAAEADGTEEEAVVDDAAAPADNAATEEAVEPADDAATEEAPADDAAEEAPAEDA